MIRINGYEYNASVAYPTERLVATIVTSEEFEVIFGKISNASEVSIVNNGETVATYACTFSGIEKVMGGYKVTFTRNPMTVHEVEELLNTVSEHTETLNSNATEFDDILAAITELGDLIAEIVGGEE